MLIKCFIVFKLFDNLISYKENVKVVQNVKYCWLKNYTALDLTTWWLDDLTAKLLEFSNALDFSKDNFYILLRT